MFEIIDDYKKNVRSRCLDLTDKSLIKSKKFKANYIKNIMKIIMDDFKKSLNNNHIDFCEYFNECVMSYIKINGEITEEIHYFRNRLNRFPRSFKDLIIDKNNWVLYSKKNTRYHMNNGYFESKNTEYSSYSSYNNEYNMKFVHKNSIFEVVVSPKINFENLSENEIIEKLKKPDNWCILTEIFTDNPHYKYDPVNMGTYNYHSNLTGKIKDKRLHNLADVKPFYSYGNVKGLLYGNSIESRNANGVIADKNPLTTEVYNYFKGIFLAI